MEQEAGTRIEKNIFFQSIAILLGLMIISGILTLLIPAGEYVRIVQSGREVINPDSFRFIDKPAYPIWRWFTAPVEVLWGSDATILITVIIFVLIVGGAFAVLERTGILGAAVTSIVSRFGYRKYLLLALVTLFFMLLGAFFGIFEEMVPLVPLMLVLAYSLGWDALVGLGMSVLATNMGFSAAITNPFTIGIAQQLADLPRFSGFWLRLPVFIIFYGLLVFFLIRYARRIERNPASSLLFGEDTKLRERYASTHITIKSNAKPSRRAVIWLVVFLGLILLVFFVSPLVKAISAISLPLVGLLFLIGGVGAGFLSGTGSRNTLAALWSGILGILPGAPLILLAASSKHIIVQGGIMDTILHAAAQFFDNLGTYPAVLLMFFIALLIEWFISSSTAKAVLIMPLLVPLADLVGVTRQLTVSAYCFGDGFTNLAYPTNVVLIIVLGLASVSYVRWMRWTMRLWLFVFILIAIILGLGTLIHYGPY